MLTSFDQVKEWITDNGFKRWVLYKDFTRKEKIIDSAAFTVSDLGDKIAMTEKYLRYAGGRAFAAGAIRMGEDDLTVTAEIRLDDMGNSQVTGVGQQTITPLNIGEIEYRVRKQIKAELREEDLKRREKEMAEKEKEFNEQKNGVIGALVGAFAPYLPVIKNLQNAGRMVAGVDTNEPVTVPPMHVDREEQAEAVEEVETEQEFTDEEADALLSLVLRWKKADPEFMPCLEKIVEMAESGDSNYALAKKFL